MSSFLEGMDGFWPLGAFILASCFHLPSPATGRVGSLLLLVVWAKS